MWEKVLVIVLIICAITGVAYSIYKHRHQPCEGDGDCKDCPLANNCKKKLENKN